jgi:hypothetical protein
MFVAAMIMIVVMVVLMMRVIVAVVMVVGAAFGIEHRFNRRQPRAEPAQHLLDDVIAPDAQPFADDLDVDVTIADVPSKPGQVVAIDGGDFNERLGLPDDPHDCAVLEHQPVAIAQRGRLRKVEQEFRAALAAQHDAAAMAVMRVECDRVDGLRLVPMAGSFNVVNALHRSNLANPAVILATSPAVR